MQNKEEIMKETIKEFLEKYLKKELEIEKVKQAVKEAKKELEKMGLKVEEEEQSAYSWNAYADISLVVENTSFSEKLEITVTRKKPYLYKETRYPFSLNSPIIKGIREYLISYGFKSSLESSCNNCKNKDCGKCYTIFYYLRLVKPIINNCFLIITIEKKEET